MKNNSETTSKILDKYLGDILKKNDLDSKYVSFLMEYIFKEDIHNKIAGFINFMNDEIKMNPDQKNITLLDIKTTLIHDVMGACNHDKKMIPRVDAYGKYAEI
tara:strand:- start:4409 stop:4717 length:309 start_codon:yes stop_codon:yes gene_type:complete